MDNTLPNPPQTPDASPVMMSQSEYNCNLETHQAFVQAKSLELTQLTEQIKSVREKKQPLAQVKETLQHEINSANIAINTISEEVTHLKQKLRYHSVKQIYGNIERLEYQLRNNNFKPREEQKILDEISMLQRSVKTLREYEAKQAENKKYRGERARLIEERNNNYSKIRALYSQEDEMKKKIAGVRGDITSNKKTIEQLRQMKPALEQVWMANHQKQQAVRNKRYEEKKRLRQELTRERHEERRKLWEEYEASKEPYEEQKHWCRVLISYLQSSVGGTTPATPASSSSLLLFPDTPSQTPVTTPSTPRSTNFPSPSASTKIPITASCSKELPSGQLVSDDTSTLNQPSTSTETRNISLMLPPDTSGSYYSKPKDEEGGFIRVSKRHKAKAKRDHRLANRVKDLPHTPDVIMKFSKLSITPPKNTDEVTSAIVSLQDCLQHFHVLSLSETNQIPVEEKSEDARAVNEVKCSRPSSLCVKERNYNGSTEHNTASSLEKDKNYIGSIEHNTVSSSVASSSTTDFESSSAATFSSNFQQHTTTSTIPLIKVDSPGVSWAAAVATEQYSGSDVLSNTLQRAIGPNHVVQPKLNTMPDISSETKNAIQIQPLYNGVHHSINIIMGQNHLTRHNGNIMPDISLEMNCNDIISQGNNESFFSMPVSYPSSFVELNNNASFSYAEVAAKVKPSTPDY